MSLPGGGGGGGGGGGSNVLQRLLLGKQEKNFITETTQLRTLIFGM